MGSIYRPTYKDQHGQKQQSAIWWARYYADGRDIRESTDTDDRNKAMEFLRTHEGKAAEGMPVLPSAKAVLFSELAADEGNDYLENDQTSIADLRCRLRKHTSFCSSAR